MYLNRLELSSPLLAWPRASKLHGNPFHLVAPGFPGRPVSRNAPFDEIDAETICVMCNARVKSTTPSAKRDAHHCALHWIRHCYENSARRFKDSSPAYIYVWVFARYIVFQTTICIIYLGNRDPDTILNLVCESYQGANICRLLSNMLTITLGERKVD